MQSAIDQVILALPTVKVTRLGLRYVNVFTAGRHFVGSVSDLALKIEVENAALVQPLHLFFSSIQSPRHTVTTRVISREFLHGKTADDASVAIDVDVFTPDNFSDSSAESIKAWAEEAHTLEKAAFRKLLPTPLYEKLRIPNDVSVQ